jgi:hypothetical protein
MSSAAAIKIGFEDRWTHARGKLAHSIAVAAHRAGEHDFACCTGIAHPIGIAAGADQISPPIEIERVYRQPEYLAAFSPTDFENVEVAADKANPDESSERTAQDAIDGARLEIALTIPGHQSFLHLSHTDIIIIGTQASLFLGGSTAWGAWNVAERPLKSESNVCTRHCWRCRSRAMRL